jgi:hypothetical protein
MYAINHAATALVLKRRFPDAALWPVLVAVQLVELLWVVFNYTGVEHVAYTRDAVHLDFLPYSHSLVTGVGLGLVAWLLLRGRGNGASLAAAVGLGIVSHVLLDVIMHEPDIAVWPAGGAPRIGLGLYDWPYAALVVEMLYGIFCWWYFRGRAALLVVIVAINLLDLAFMLPHPGEGLMFARHPAMLPTIILVQIVVTWLLVAWLAAGRRMSPAAAGD